MRRFLLVPLFALGAVVGFGSELHHGGASSCRWQDRQAAYEQRLADTCACPDQSGGASAAVNAQRTAAQAAPIAAPAPAAPANVPVVIVNTIPGQGGGVGYPYPVQLAPAPQYAPAPQQYQLVPVPPAPQAANPAPSTSK